MGTKTKDKKTTTPQWNKEERINKHYILTEIKILLL